MGELKAHKIKCKPFNKLSFTEALNDIRSLTAKDPDVFVPKIKKMCEQNGVSLVLVPELSRVPWNGATKWLTPDKAMIILSLRGKREDKFWFTFFHEAGHILHDSKKDIFINDGKAEDEREIKADKFASNLLIPQKYNRLIINSSSDLELKQIAKKLDISTGIVVGRYQFLTKEWSRFNHLITKLEWA